MTEGSNWTDAQNDAIVADYFAMLADDASGRTFHKAEHNRALQKVIGRSRGSIEFKHQNISAVLKGLGEGWISGYKPAFNFQISLIDAVARWLAANPDSFVQETAGIVHSPGLHEERVLWIGPPPTHSNAPPPKEFELMNENCRKIQRRGARRQKPGAWACR